MPYPKDPSTQMNTDFVQMMANDADEIIFTGEALSHCTAESFDQIAEELGDEFVKKCVLLTDGTSPVTGFESYGEAFLNKFIPRGLRTTTCADYLK